MNYLGPILAGGFLLAILAGSAWWTIAQWLECREAGMTIFYCIAHIS